MTLPEIKTLLPLSQVLHHYALTPDRNNRLHCPFHPDKTPSMQVYYKTNTVFCFSSNCKTNRKSLDVIDFVLYMEGFDSLGMTKGKHQAIEKCKAIINEMKLNPNENPQPVSHATQLTKTTMPEKAFTNFQNTLHNSPENLGAKEYLQSRSLDYNKLEVGYNDGKAPQDNGFGKYCIIFPLKNKQGEIVSLYGRSILPEQNGNDTGSEKAKNSRHFYQKNRSGLYPRYPSPTTKKLLLTESIIDAATFLQIPNIAQTYSIISAYGTNGLNEEIKNAIKELTELQEIIFAFDNDSAGKAGAEKYSQELHELLPHITISQIPIP